ncbi:hypothetical protein E2320_000530 [Naja naja]|nr:hypothetical protein E2320_000530 [Naja naja]
MHQRRFFCIRANGQVIQKRQIFVGRVCGGCTRAEGVAKLGKEASQPSREPTASLTAIPSRRIGLGTDPGAGTAPFHQKELVLKNMLHTKVKTEKPGIKWKRTLERHHQMRSARTLLLLLQERDTYIIKLFDRSVDLAQFSENTPLYPICRAWMRNSPMVREQERSPSPNLPTLLEDEEGVEVLNGKIQDVYKLPSPIPCQTNPAGEPINLRIPFPPASEEETKVAAEMVRPSCKLRTSEAVPSMSTLIYKNMERWKKIRQRWKEASQKNQLRYAESMKILKEMYERQ